MQMARVELRNTYIRIRDGLAGTAAVDQALTPPVVTDTTLTLKTISLNTDVAARVPVGARFLIAGETAATTLHVVTARTQGTGSGTNAKQSVALDVSGPGCANERHLHLDLGGQDDRWHCL